MPHKLLQFNDKRLRTQALTHRSFANEQFPPTPHNERLEFLGDALLNFLSAEYLYQLDPEMDEARMTRQRSALVDEKQLARFAIEIGLDSKMRLGQGAMKDGGCHNPNLLSSTFEAVVGAYYLDHDRRVESLRPLIEELFQSVPQDIMMARSDIDLKNRLQEFVQKNNREALPKYVTEKTGGTDHAPEFHCRVYVNEELWGEGKGRSKKEAEKSAADDALTQAEEWKLF